jgi:hypothetical protein
MFLSNDCPIRSVWLKLKFEMREDEVPKVIDLNQGSKASLLGKYRDKLPVRISRPPMDHHPGFKNRTPCEKAFSTLHTKAKFFASQQYWSVEIPFDTLEFGLVSRLHIYFCARTTKTLSFAFREVSQKQ